MAINITRISHRPSASISFYSPPQNMIDYFNTTWVLPGSITRTKTLTETGLTETLMITFINEATFISFVENPIMSKFRSDREIYNNNNNIISYSQKT